MVTSLCDHGLSFINDFAPDYIIVTGFWGCRAVFGSHQMQLAWCKEWAQMDIMQKELVPIVLNCAV